MYSSDWASTKEKHIVKRNGKEEGVNISNSVYIYASTIYID